MVPRSICRAASLVAVLTCSVGQAASQATDPREKVQQWTGLHRSVAGIEISWETDMLPPLTNRTDVRQLQRVDFRGQWPVQYRFDQIDEYRTADGRPIEQHPEPMLSGPLKGIFRFTRTVDASGQSRTWLASSRSPEPRLGSTPDSLSESAPRYVDLSPWVAARYIDGVGLQHVEITSSNDQVIVRCKSSQLVLVFATRGSVFLLIQIDRGFDATSVPFERIVFESYQVVSGVPFEVPQVRLVSHRAQFFNDATGGLDREADLRFAGRSTLRTFRVRDQSDEKEWTGRASAPTNSAASATPQSEGSPTDRRSDAPTTTNAPVPWRKRPEVWLVSAAFVVIATAVALRVKGRA